MSRIFRYILRHDGGMAPCVKRGWLTLATCKPRIRASAKVGEWVIGCRPRPEPRGLVVWAGRVARSVEVGDYQREYSWRTDAIYRAKEGGGFERLCPEYHPTADGFRKDTSAPVLIFDRKATWYFGDEACKLPKCLMHLAASGRPDRVNGVTEEDCAALETWLRSIATPGIHGTPRDMSPKKRCRC